MPTISALSIVDRARIRSEPRAPEPIDADADRGGALGGGSASSGARVKPAEAPKNVRRAKSVMRSDQPLRGLASAGCHRSKPRRHEPHLV